jgi:hypothetical protein
MKLINNHLDARTKILHYYISVSLVNEISQISLSRDNSYFLFASTFLFSLYFSQANRLDEGRADVEMQQMISDNKKNLSSSSVWDNIEEEGKKKE